MSAEFDRVSKAFAAVANKQQPAERADTFAVIAILEEKQAEEMAKAEAGYFIRNWQELTDQVRRMISQDSRYQAIKSHRKART